MHSRRIANRTSFSVHFRKRSVIRIVYVCQRNWQIEATYGPQEETEMLTHRPGPGIPALIPGINQYAPLQFLRAARLPVARIVCLIPDAAPQRACPPHAITFSVS